MTNDYFLRVEGILVKVGKEEKEKVEEEEKEVNEEELLSTLRDAFANVTQPPPKREEESVFPYRPHPKNFLADIRSGNQELLAKFIKENDNDAFLRVMDNHYNPYDLPKLCALGGFPRSLNFIREKYLKIGDTTFEEDEENEWSEYCLAGLATYGGHTNMMPIITKRKLELFDLVDIAKKSGNVQLVYKIKALYDAMPEEERPNRPSIREQNRNMPSLVNICLSVVQSLLSLRTLSPSRISMPSNLFVTMCENLAEDSLNGYATLDLLKKENSDLGPLIPTSVLLRAMYTSEQRMRDLTYRNPPEFEGIEYTPNLIQVFAEYDTFVIEPVDEFEEGVKKFNPQPREVGANSIVNQSQFLQNFNTFTDGLFEGFDFSNMVILGGSVIGSLLPLPPSSPPAAEYYKSQSPFKGSDVDIAIYGIDDVEEFKKKAIEIYHQIEKITKQEVRILRSASEVVFYSLYPFRIVQVTWMKFSSIWQILCGVDIDSSAFAFDGKTLWCSPRARMAVNRRWTVTNGDLSGIRGSPTYERRLIKYSKRGFTIVDIDFDKYNEAYVDKAPRIYIEYGWYWETKGAALLGSAFRWPEVMEKFDDLKIWDVPHGPDVTYEDLDEWLEWGESMMNDGYSPDSGCLENAGSLDEFEKRDMNFGYERPFDVGSWYGEMKSKNSQTAENENENSENIENMVVDLQPQWQL